MQAVMDSCFAKAAMSGVAGFGLGGVFGLFMASVGLVLEHGSLIWLVKAEWEPSLTSMR